MSRHLLRSISNFFNQLERLFLPYGGPQPALTYLTHKPSIQIANTTEKFSLKNLIGDGILWAVPKHRRSIEKRLSRKFGVPEYVWKPLREKRNLRSCQHCGHDHELGVLCRNCYEKVQQETKQMQEKIEAQLGLNPVEQEVIVLYEGETAQQMGDALDGKRIIEMNKPRPMWFTKNLLQKSTQQSSTTKEVKPTNLG